MGPSGRGGNEVAGGWMEEEEEEEEEEVEGRPSLTLCEGKQRVRRRGEEEFGDHDRAADLWRPAGRRKEEKEEEKEEKEEEKENFSG